MSERYVGMPYTGNASSDKAFQFAVYYKVPESVARANGWTGNAIEIADLKSKDCLARLADEIEMRAGKPRNTIIRLLRHMAEHPRAMYEELRQHVHEGYPAADSTVEGNIREAQAEIKRAALPVQLSTKGFVVVRIDKSE